MAMLQRPDGVNLYYEVHGAGHQPTILLTHGYSATSQMWKGQVDALSEPGARRRDTPAGGRARARATCSCSAGDPARRARPTSLPA